MSRGPRQPTHPEARKEASAERLMAALPFVLVGMPLLLYLIDWLIGFPPRPVTRAAGLWGAGLGVAALVLLLARGWRVEWVWYPVAVGMLMLGGAMAALAAAAVITLMA